MAIARHPFHSDEEYIEALQRLVNDQHQDIMRYLKSFHHTHMAGRAGNIDKCHKCGLDLRDRIHYPMLPESKVLLPPTAGNEEGGHDVV